MKKIYIAFIFAISMNGFSQESKSATQLTKFNEKIISADSNLGLTQDQKQKALVIFENMNKALVDLKKETLSEQDFAEKSKVIYKEYYAKVHKEVLTPEQKTALQKVNK